MVMIESGGLELYVRPIKGRWCGLINLSPGSCEGVIDGLYPGPCVHIGLIKGAMRPILSICPVRALAPATGYTVIFVWG